LWRQVTAQRSLARVVAPSSSTCMCCRPPARRGAQSRPCRSPARRSRERQLVGEDGDGIAVEAAGVRFRGPFNLLRNWWRSLTGSLPGARPAANVKAIVLRAPLVEPDAGKGRRGGEAACGRAGGDRATEVPHHQAGGSRAGAHRRFFSIAESNRLIGGPGG
jgi:hypothetical protein